MTTRLLAGLGLAGCLVVASGCGIIRVTNGANGTSVSPSLSANGRFVAFVALATLECGSDAFREAILVHDLLTGANTCVTGAVHRGPLQPRLSANASVVAFAARADTEPDDTNGATDVFVIERAGGRATRVSVATDGTQGDDASDDPAISADGRVVAFVSSATTLGGCPGSPGLRHVHVHDRFTRSTTCVSVALDGTPGNGSSFNPSLSADGHFVAFTSQATNLDPRCANLTGLMETEGHIYVHDRGASPPTTTCISLRPDGVPASGPSQSPALSADGRLVVFASRAGNLVPGLPFPTRQILLLDRATGAFDLVSADARGGQGDDDSGTPALSADGRVVVFASRSVLDGVCNNGVMLVSRATQVFVHERLTRTSRCLSVSDAGVPGNGDSLYPMVSADGRVVAFQSDADHLTIEADRNGGNDIFAVNLVPIPGQVATGTGEGGSHVRADGREIFPYGPAFAGGTRVAMCDLTDDGVADLVVGPGPGGPPELKIYDGTTGAFLGSFQAYAPGVTGGVHVACGDVTGDGRADIVTGAIVGGIPTVNVFDGVNGQRVRSFAAYGAGFTADLRVAVCDLTGDGQADVVTAPGPGFGPEVRAFDGRTGGSLGSGPVFDPAFTGGVYVACGDVTGDGRPDVVFGRDAGGLPEVRVFDPVTGQSGSFLAYDPAFRGGVRVAVCHLTGRPQAEIMTGAGPGGAPEVRFFAGQTGLPLPFPLGSFLPYDPAFPGGVYVACAPS